VDCDLEEFWAITNEVYGHSEYKVCNQIVAHYTFFSKRRPQLAIVSEQRPRIILAQLALLLNSDWPTAQIIWHGQVSSTDPSRKMQNRTLVCCWLNG